MRFVSYFNTALLLIAAYDGSMPLANYLKQYFAQHKKHGSKDRKYISHLCYCYYRLGHAVSNAPAGDRLKAALFLCMDDIAEWAALFDEQWMQHHSLSLQERIAFIHSQLAFNPNEIFPWQDIVSAGIDAGAFSLSHLTQPDLFLRARPGKMEGVRQALSAHHVPYNAISGDAIAVTNSTKVDTIVHLNKDAVVQDHSSQQVAELLKLVPQSSKALAVWDCCAASGGKSILAYDTLSKIDLTVSDIRPSIIHNLQQRFSEAGLPGYKSFVADLAAPNAMPAGSDRYDLIICDAPCSGSGTWGRTPEQLYFFAPGKIAYYSHLQKRITTNIIPYLRPNGYLLYITCSVFEQENEAMVHHILQQGLTLVQQRLFTGYGQKADTMFAALFNR